MYWLITLPFIVQAVVILCDEYYFHLRRGLPRFERIGHPIDTLSFLLCLCIVLFIPYSGSMLKLYVVFSLISCLLVTKDEFVHQKHCEGSEHWLHALLFLNHPILLASLGILWPLFTECSLPAFWTRLMPHKELFHLFIVGQALFVTLFFLYQLLFWNFIWKKDDPPIKV